MASPQTLEDADRRLVALWAADCAELVLPLFEAEAPDDSRVRDGILRARAYGRGELDAAGEIKRRFVAGRAAQSAKSPAAVAAARSSGQASGVAHMGAHALGAAAYAARAASLAASDQETARRDEVRWQIKHMTGEVRTALSKLPLLEEDSSGPLGSGLLSSGALTTTIHEIQPTLAGPLRSSSSRKTWLSSEQRSVYGRGPAPFSMSPLATPWLPWIPPGLIPGRHSSMRRWPRAAMSTAGYWRSGSSPSPVMRSASATRLPCHCVGKRWCADA
jgi:hypothetical protein